MSPQTPTDVAGERALVAVMNELMDAIQKARDAAGSIAGRSGVMQVAGILEREAEMMREDMRRRATPLVYQVTEG